MRNKFTVRLTLYFLTVLVIFALVVGGLFRHLFKENAIDQKRREMNQRATKIAQVITKDLPFMERRYGEDISRSRLINTLDNASPEIVWVVDGNRNLNMNLELIREALLSGKVKITDIPANGQEAYKRLPDKIRHKVERAFRGKSFSLEEYNKYLGATMITVGEPVYDIHGNVRAVVLLHSPVEGVEKAINQGIHSLLVSLAIALGCVLVLSAILSWSFTKPMNTLKKIVERLANKEYHARTNIKQQDEIGELAEKLDILAERLGLAEEESAKLEKLRREFIANISHELRTPVTVIKGSLEALRDGVITEPEDVEEFHRQMLKESEFLQRLINDLLELSRLQNTDFAIEMERINLCEVIGDAVRGAKRLGAEKKLEVKSELDTEIYPLQGDYGRLRQMLMIFLHNSVKFSPVNSTLEICLKGNRLSVTDHGCGIKPEDVPHAFDRFYKAHNEQNKSGSGLGLAIAKQIAVRHGIELEMESRLGEGTTITAVLPDKLKGEG